jgi:hypothetical protein
MIKNRRILILSNLLSIDKNSDEGRVAKELSDLGNEVFCLAGLSRTTRLYSRFVFNEITPQFTSLRLEVGSVDAIMRLLGKSNAVERLASDLVFEMGKLFDVVLSFESTAFQNLSIFYAKVNLLLLRGDLQPELINSSVDHVVVLNREQISAGEIWDRISSQNRKKAPLDHALDRLG